MEKLLEWAIPLVIIAAMLGLAFSDTGGSGGPDDNRPPSYYENLQDEEDARFESSIRPG